jgi:hypothetical protein
MGVADHENTAKSEKSAAVLVLVVAAGVFGLLASSAIAAPKIPILAVTAFVVTALLSKLAS